MGMKPRAKAEYKPKCRIVLKRDDGYESTAEGLSYEAGLAISVIVNRDRVGETIVSWDEDGDIRTVEVPRR